MTRREAARGGAPGSGGAGVGAIVGIALVLVLAVTGIAIGRGAVDHDDARERPAQRVADAVDTIAQRVEKLRELKFDSIPKPQIETPAEVREAVSGDLDEEYPQKRRDADADLLELLGLVPPGTDLGKLSADIGGEQIAGYYDPKRKRLVVVDGDAAADPVLAEITLAHELTHALEDQRFGVKDPGSKAADDRNSAFTALVEGTATVVMQEYAQRYISPAASLASAFSAAGPAAESTAGVPPYVQRSLEFSYTGGVEFVGALRDKGGWKLVNRAIERRKPASTEQIMHPDKYLDPDPPDDVAIGDPGLGSDWKRVRRGTLGEWDTRELLRVGNGDLDAATRAAAGWGGGSYELWRNSAAADGCDDDPCRQADVLVLRWSWDTPDDAREFDAALPLYLTGGLDATPVPGGGAPRWEIDGGGAAIALGADGTTTTLAFAPTPERAAAVAAR